jgi:hypothetical protein
MRQRIADELANDGDISTAQINYAINDAIKLYQRRPWWFNVRMVTFVTSANGEYYVSTPSATFDDMVAVQSIMVENNGVKTPMVAVDNLEIDFSQDGSVTGVPCNYSRTANKLRFFPIPDAAYTISLTFVYKMDALVNDTDENAWTNEAEELIRQCAKRRIALNYLQSEEVAARFASLEREAYAEMMAENRRRWPNTLLRVPPMLGPETFNINTGW